VDHVLHVVLSGDAVIDGHRVPRHVVGVAECMRLHGVGEVGLGHRPARGVVGSRHRDGLAVYHLPALRHPLHDVEGKDAVLLRPRGGARRLREHAPRVGDQGVVVGVGDGVGLEGALGLPVEVVGVGLPRQAVRPVVVEGDPLAVGVRLGGEVTGSVVGIGPVAHVGVRHGGLLREGVVGHGGDVLLGLTLRGDDLRQVPQGVVGVVRDRAGSVRHLP